MYIWNNVNFGWKVNYKQQNYIEYWGSNLEGPIWTLNPCAYCTSGSNSGRGCSRVVLGGCDDDDDDGIAIS